MASMEGKVALVTGATGGIGGAIATALAREGATVAVVGRSKGRAEDAMRNIRARVPDAKLEPLVCDLSSQTSVRNAAREFITRHNKLDVLVNCAGVFRKRRETTPDGLEMTFATNVMGYYLLTSELLPALKAAAPARIVNLASRYGGAKIAFDDLQTEKGNYSIMRSTPPTMLGRVLLTQELAQRLQGTGVVVNAVHPGLVKNTELLKDVGGMWAFITNTFGGSTEKGADTAVWLATAPETATVTGKMWAGRKELKTPGMGSDPEARRRFWNECERLSKTA